MARLRDVVFDCRHPASLARFWAAALDGYDVAPYDDAELERLRATGVDDPEDDPTVLVEAPGRAPRLWFQRAPEPKRGKNRIHLDLASRSDEHQAALVARLEELGARRIDIGQPATVSWDVMADPEGNEMCVVSHRGSVGKDPASAFGDLWPIAAVVFDCLDPEAVAPFWAAATGWPILGRDDEGVWLRDVDSDAPYLDLHRVTEPKQAKLRVHLDVTAADAGSGADADAGRDALMARLVELGGRPADIGQGDADDTWVVMADAEGNEVCVFP